MTQKEEIIARLKAATWSIGRDLCPSQSTRHFNTIHDAIAYIEESVPDEAFDGRGIA